MVRRVLAIGVLLAAVGLSTGCGKSTTTTAPTGTLFTFISDTPFCDILALRMSASGATLGVSGTTQVVTLLSSLTTVISLNLAALRDAATVLAHSSLAPRSYDRMSMTLSAPTIVVYDPTQDPPINTIPATLTTGSSPVLYNIEPPVTVTNSGVSAISMDFNIAQSVEVDSEGQVTGNVTPVATVTALTPSTSNGFGELDGLEGFITTVQASQFTSGQTTFNGAIVLQLLPSTVSGTGGPTVTVGITSNTQLCGPATVSNQPCTPPPLNEILTDSYAWVDGFVDSSGNFEATTIDIENQADLADDITAFIGTVLSVTEDTAGNVTSFTLFERDQEPPAGFQIAVDSVVNVNLTPATIYQSSAPATNFAGLPFGPSAIAVGQDVIVHGTFVVPTTPPAPAKPVPPIITAAKVYVELQTHQGNLVSLLSAQPDNRTGAFTFFPCATMFQLTEPAALPIYVFTNASTSFVNAAGLSSLQAQPGILVRGLLYLEPQSVTINGVTVPAGKLVLLAKQVVQLT